MGQNSAKVILSALLLLSVAACASTAPHSDARLSSDTTQVSIDDLDGGARSSDQQPVGSGGGPVEDTAEGAGEDDSDNAGADPTIVGDPILIDLVRWGGQWAYDADGIEDSGWTETDFDDSTWQIGEAPFGRDEPDTTIFDTPASGTTGWLRGRFTLDDPAIVERLDIEALVDDGFVVYLNGFEVHRWNLPAGPLTAGSFTIERITGDDELIVRRETDLATEALVAGENIVAVAIHQGAPDSSDLRFDLRLAATTLPKL